MRALFGISVVKTLQVMLLISVQFFCTSLNLVLTCVCLRIVFSHCPECAVSSFCTIGD